MRRKCVRCFYEFAYHCIVTESTIHKGWSRSPDSICVMNFSLLKNMFKNLSLWQKDAAKDALQNCLCSTPPNSSSKEIICLEIHIKKTC
jgi:hypothetical protein